MEVTGKNQVYFLEITGNFNLYFLEITGKILLKKYPRIGNYKSNIKSTLGYLFYLFFIIFVYFSFPLELTIK